MERERVGGERQWGKQEGGKGKGRERKRSRGKGGEKPGGEIMGKIKTVSFCHCCSVEFSDQVERNGEFILERDFRISWKSYGILEGCVHV